MRALPLIRRRVVLARDAFAEVVVWRVHEPVKPSSHLFKYRLAYVVGGERVHNCGPIDRRFRSRRDEVES